MKLKQLKQTSMDFFYNILASVVLTGVMQIVVYPLLAKWVSLSEYGTIVTAMGLINTVVGGIGTALNNTRLVMNTDYKKREVIGDFNLVLVLACIISAISLTVLGKLYLSYNFFLSLMIGFTSIFMVCRQYFVVEYRLILNFKKILLCNVFGACGYLVGIGLFYVGLRIWPLVFFSSEVFSLVYIMKTTSVWKEPFERTDLFRSMISKTLLILISVLFANMLTYFDRIFLYPILGSESVSIYTVASFFGKSLAIVMTPISGVLLGYFAQDNYRFSRKKFVAFDGLIMIISLIFAAIAYVISPFITSFLYPDIFTLAKPYVFIANTAAIIAVSCNMIQTVILKYSPSFYQIVKEGLYALIYFSLSYFLMNQFGLAGFCVAALVSNISKYIIISVMGLITFKKGNEKNV